MERFFVLLALVVLCGCIEQNDPEKKLSQVAPNRNDVRALASIANGCELDGMKLLSGESKRFYSTETVRFGAECSGYSDVRVCDKGSLSGNSVYRFKACAPVKPIACVLDGVTVAHGSSVRFYSTRTVSPGLDCQGYSDVRACSNGTFSGNNVYQFRSCAQVGSVATESAASAASITAAESWSRAKAVWRNLYPANKVGTANLLREGDSFSALYMGQFSYMNFAIRARKENDRAVLSEIADYANVALSWLRDSSGAGMPITPMSWRDIRSSMTWNYKTYPNGDLNTIVQWMYFIGYHMHSVAMVPDSERTPAMRTFLDVYSMLFVYNIDELVFRDDGAMAWNLNAWNCGGDRKISHETITTLKLSYAMPSLPDAPCNAILDWDQQLWGAALEYVAAAQFDPARVNYFNDQMKDQRLRAYLRTAYDVMERHRTWTTVTNFQNRQTDALVFDLGAWAVHWAYQYSAYEGATPPTSPSQKRMNPNVGEDLGHHIRYTWVLLSFFDNKSVIDRQFPTARDLGYFMNQLVYRVYNRNPAAPSFTTYWDGSNGWFRITPEEGGTLASGGPNSGAGAVIRGGVGFYQPFQSDLKQMMGAVATAFVDSGQAGATARRSLDQGVWMARLTSGGWSDCMFNGGSWGANCMVRSPWLGFGMNDSETLSFYSQYFGN